MGFSCDLFHQGILSDEQNLELNLNWEFLKADWLELVNYVFILSVDIVIIYI
jgi:hypothetical protein